MGLAAVALVLSQVTNSRLWLHSTGRLHDWYHLVPFAALGLLAMLASPLRSARVSWVLFALMLGFAMELGEALRYGGLLEWGDVGMDAVGVAVGAVAGWVASRLLSPREEDDL
jgi:hypothetical protein